MNVWSTIRTRWRRSASSTSLRAWSDVSAMGFSSQRCLPAFSVAMPSSKCVATGVAIAIASIVGSPSSSWKSVVTFTAGKRRCTLSSFVRSTSATAAASAPRISAKFRTRFGPQ